jgi:hemin uptake protein HemP
MTNEKENFFTRENQQPTHRVIDSKDLMGPSNYLDIAHEGEIYRLRITKFRKLILTK